MGNSWLIYLMSGIVGGVLLAALVMAMFRRKETSAVDIEQLRETNLTLTRDLAIQLEKSGRIGPLEMELSVERQARSTAEIQSATSASTNAQLDEVTKDLRTRLAKAEAQLKTNSETSERALQDLRKQQGATSGELATIKEAREQEAGQAAEKLEILLNAKELMKQEFSVMANELMNRHGEVFAKQNKDQMEVLLNPLQLKINEFQQGLLVAHTDSAKERATLGEQIRQLSDKSAQMASETINLTKALKGKAQTQGAWGEMVLSLLLERSGLRKGEEYVTQENHQTEDGNHVKPDVIVNLPGGNHVVIDAKVSLTAFEVHVNASTDEERESALNLHVASIKNHIKGLSSKDYQSVTGGGLDYVIMFVPIEGALAVALQKDPELTSYAVEKNVAIATPTTLMIALRTIDNVWKIERRNQNAEAIADRAGSLYNKLVGFTEDMVSLGSKIGQAQASYSSAMAKLQNGTGNLIRQADQLKALGAKTSKTMPKQILTDGGANDAELSSENIAATTSLFYATPASETPIILLEERAP